eukprot:CAMPEP_0206163444 /NCGR_PEP_ID=MMETSP1474-20131121/11415_1 /ASSEMBLY_ACC=CAM_ASM_001110 /TAXON_ID=97495 /ORGANISM="Imantonia sp., Strain RCC918" /LENGTH=392 /DNA_ID=CAMNT_0053565947 /DNA_START=29 /DNA_END=1204 /DNA_ORIENTATION=-
MSSRAEQALEELGGLSLEELEAMAKSSDLDQMLFDDVGHNSPFVSYEAEVRAAHATALVRLRQHAGDAPRGVELLRLLEIEEHTRCQAFQATLMGEVRGHTYQGAVRSIIEKLLGKLEHFAVDMTLYQAMAQSLSEYMSALNHHCDMCASMQMVQSMPLPAIREGAVYDDVSSDMYSERSEDTESVQSEAFSNTDSLAERSPAFGDASRTLSAAEAALSAAELRKQRRRESNKKAATKYRNKKASTTQEVLAESVGLRSQLTACTSQNAVLLAENRLLKQQVAFLQGLLASSHPAAAASAAAAAAAAEGVPTKEPAGMHATTADATAVKAEDAAVSDLPTTLFGAPSTFGGAAAGFVFNAAASPPGAAASSAPPMAERSHSMEDADQAGSEW